MEQCQLLLKSVKSVHHHISAKYLIDAKVFQILCTLKRFYKNNNSEEQLFLCDRSVWTLSVYGRRFLGWQLKGLCFCVTTAQMHSHDYITRIQLCDHLEPGLWVSNQAVMSLYKHQWNGSTLTYLYKSHIVCVSFLLVWGLVFGIFWFIVNHPGKKIKSQKVDSVGEMCRLLQSQQACPNL